ncbi:MAG: hypothetical protein ACLFRH_01485 [Halothiobacillaceae bacterium]
MTEILVGIGVMAAFIAFVIWKNRGRQKPPTDWDQQRWWAEREAGNRAGPRVHSSAEASRSDDRQDDRDGDDPDDDD